MEGFSYNINSYIKGGRMKKIIYFLFLALCVFSLFSCVTTNTTTDNVNQKSAPQEIPPCPEDVALASFVGVMSMNENNYYALPGSLVETENRIHGVIKIKDVNIFLSDLEKVNVKEQPLPDEFSQMQERALLDVGAASIFEIYYPALNNGKGDPINFCFGDIKYSKDDIEHNGWSISYILFHVTHKMNYINGQYEVDKMEYRFFSY